MEKITEIEKIIKAEEKKESFKEKGSKLLPSYQKENWDKAVDESAYSLNHLKDIDLLIKLKYGLQRGLSIKDALSIYTHRYKEIPLEKVDSLVCTFTEYGPEFVNLHRKNNIKKVLTKMQK